MKRFFTSLSLFAALTFSLFAEAGSDRYVIENGTTGAATSTANPTLIFGQRSTVLVAHTCVANSCTRADPSGATEGLELQSVSAYRVYVCVSTGTLSGTGTLDAWVYDPEAAAWMAMPSKNLTVSGTKACMAFPVEVNSSRAPGFRLVYKSNAVATSAAAPTLTVGIRACTQKAGAAGCGVP